MFKKIIEKIKTNKNRRNRSAFSMIEIVAVLLVVSIGMGGIMSLIIQNIQTQSVSRKNLVAYQLAQEGVELIRQIRDTNWLGSSEWTTNLSAGNYYMDYLMATPYVSTQISDGRLIKNQNNMYVSSPGDMSQDNFSRIISISYPDPTGVSGKMLINSTVYWTDRNNSYNYSIEAALYDWK